MSRRGVAKESTTARILSATEGLLAEGLLAEGSFASVSLQAIADRSGVTVQTVLRHMGSRDGCLSALRDRVRARIDAQRGHSPPGDVEAALAGLLNHYEHEGQLVHNLIAQAAERATVIDALVVATDLSIWTLLRLDLGRSPVEAAAVFSLLVCSILEPR